MSTPCVFFDVDGTLWNDKSVISFYRILLETKFGSDKNDAWGKFITDVDSSLKSGTSREVINEWFYREHFRDQAIEEIEAVARTWWDRQTRRDDFWVTNMVQRVYEHRDAGHCCVLVTGSFREILRPLCDKFGVTHMLCAPLEEINHHYTGRLHGIPMIGRGKAQAVIEFMRTYQIDPEFTYGYGDDDSDFYFLERVRHATLVASTESLLAQAARKRGWAVLSPRFDAAEQWIAATGTSSFALNATAQARVPGKS